MIQKNNRFNDHRTSDKIIIKFGKVNKCLNGGKYNSHVFTKNSKENLISNGTKFCDKYMIIE